MQGVASKMLRLGEAAKLLDVSYETLWRWCEAGKIRHIRMPSGQRRIRREDIDRILHPDDIPFSDPPTEA
jgi:excisionase family DNA binding protein